MTWKNFFRKFKKEDTIDLSDLQKRGILKPRQSLDKERGTIDLTSSRSDSSSSNPLGFLGSLAGASSSSSSSESSSGNSEAETTPSFSSKKQELKGILRDLKARIDSVYDRTYKLSERIGLIERKIERLERRAGVSE